MGGVPAIVADRPTATCLIGVAEKVALETTAGKRNNRAYMVPGKAEDDLRRARGIKLKQKSGGSQT